MIRARRRPQGRGRGRGGLEPDAVTRPPYDASRDAPEPSGDPHHPRGHAVSPFGFVPPDAGVRRRSWRDAADRPGRVLDLGVRLGLVRPTCSFGPARRRVVRLSGRWFPEPAGGPGPLPGGDGTSAPIRSRSRTPTATSTRSSAAASSSTSATPTRASSNCDGSCVPAAPSTASSSPTGTPLERIARATGLYYHGMDPRDRLYTMASARELLTRHGFTVLELRHANMLPLTLSGSAARRSAGAIWRANRALARLPGLNALATNVELVARDAGRLRPPINRGRGPRGRGPGVRGLRLARDGVQHVALAGPAVHQPGEGQRQGAGGHRQRAARAPPGTGTVPPARTGSRPEGPPGSRTCSSRPPRNRPGRAAPAASRRRSGSGGGEIEVVPGAPEPPPLPAAEVRDADDQHASGPQRSAGPAGCRPPGSSTCSSDCAEDHRVVGALLELRVGEHAHAHVEPASPRDPTRPGGGLDARHRPAPRDHPGTEIAPPATDVEQSSGVASSPAGRAAPCAGLPSLQGLNRGGREPQGTGGQLVGAVAARIESGQLRGARRRKRHPEAAAAADGDLEAARGCRAGVTGELSSARARGPAARGAARRRRAYRPRRSVAGRRPSRLTAIGASPATG